VARAGHGAGTLERLVWLLELLEQHLPKPLPGMRTKNPVYLDIETEGRQSENGQAAKHLVKNQAFMPSDSDVNV
jgi:hypothetical protein